MTCNNTIEPVDHSPTFLRVLYEKKPPPFFLRTPFSLPLPSFLSFFLFSPPPLFVLSLFKEKKEKWRCVSQEGNQSKKEKEKKVTNQIILLNNYLLKRLFAASRSSLFVGSRLFAIIVTFSSDKSSK